MQLEKLPVFFGPEQNVERNDSFSPSAGKPAHLVRQWQEEGLPIEIKQPEPVTVEDFKRAHDADYVDGVLECRRANGFGNTSEAVARSLPHTTGSLASAASEAISNGQVAVSPSSGFHHAGYHSGGGYCTFNGLVVTAQKLKESGAAQTVGILDLDRHYGNGTDDIIDELDLDYIQHYTFGGERITPQNAEAWLAQLPDIVRSFKGVDVLLYQAGADPHINDPLGGILTDEQLARRDEIVFNVCLEEEIPVAWNLAGGYQTPLQKVLDVHTTTVKTCIDVYIDGARAAREDLAA